MQSRLSLKSLLSKDCIVHFRGTVHATIERTVISVLLVRYSSNRSATTVREQYTIPLHLYVGLNSGDRYIDVETAGDEDATGMNNTRYLPLLLGRSTEDDPGVPLHYPLLAVLAIATSIAPTTWFLSDYHGYLLSGSALCLIILYGGLFTDLRLSIDTGFLVLFGGYWLGLLAHYLVLPNPSLLEYVLVTPVAVVGTVVVLPRLIESRRQAFAMGLTLLSVAVMLIGVWMLWRTHTAGVEYPRSPW